MAAAAVVVVVVMMMMMAKVTSLMVRAAPPTAKTVRALAARQRLQAALASLPLSPSWSFPMQSIRA